MEAKQEQPKYFMRRVCSFCDTEYGQQPCAPENHGKKTHGMCQPLCEPALKLGWGDLVIRKEAA